LKFGWVPLLLGVCMVALIAGCGGDDDDGGDAEESPDPVTAYFQQLSAIGALASVQLLTIDQQFPNAFEEVEPTKQYYGEYVRVYDGFVEQSRDLAPPDEVADQHAAYVAAGEEIQQLAQARLQALDGAATKEEMDAIFAADGFTEALARYDFACSELKRIADAEPVPVPGLQDCISSN
jgi:hypothetical protein